MGGGWEWIGEFRVWGLGFGGMGFRGWIGGMGFRGWIGGLGGGGDRGG